MRLLAIIVLIFGVACLVLVVPVKAVAAYSISMDAGPSCIPADGKSYSQILITVVDQSGAPVPDGTEARLTSSAGEITPIVYTYGGRGTGILTSSPSPQVAIVNATVPGASGSIQVEFSSIDEVPTGARTIRVAGGTVAYSTDRDVVMASSSVTIEYKGLTIQASSAQVWQMLGQIRAQGEVTIKHGDQIVTADALNCDIHTDRIRVLDSGDKCTTRTFDVGKLKLISIQTVQADSQDFTPLDSTGTTNWIISQRLVVFPGEKILFFKASIYVGESKIIKMPYYSYSYQKRESILQQVQYSSTEGTLVDLPFYYRMADSGTGAVKLRYAERGDESGSYYRPRRGMSLGLEQAYTLNDKNQGRLFVDGVGNSSQAFELTHHLEYGSLEKNGRADFAVRYQPTSSYAKGIYNTTMNASGGLGNYDYSVFGYFGGSRIQQWNYLDPANPSYIEQSDCSIRTVFRPRTPLSARGALRMSPSYTIGYGQMGFSSTGSNPSCLYQSLGMGYSFARTNNRKNSLSFDGTSAFTMTANGNKGINLRIGPTMRSRWNGGSMSLTYTLNFQAGSTDSVSLLSKHLIGGNISLSRGSRWNTNTFFGYGLDTGRLNLYSNLNYNLAGKWQMRMNYNLYRYTNKYNGMSYKYETSYVKTGIYRPIGPYEVGLAWSPTGQDYGLKQGKRLWLEFGVGGY